MPNPCGPWKDSPESFSRILLYAGLAFLTLFFPAFVVAAMRLRSRDLKSRGIVTNYVRPRTLWSAGLAPALPAAANRNQREGHQLCHTLKASSSARRSQMEQ